MVNNEEFIKRLQLILSHYGLSAAAFADSIEVQRSSISHLLSGRNKPSLDFVLKVVQTYSEVNLYWLLNGQGRFPSEKTATLPLKKHSKTTNSVLQKEVQENPTDTESLIFDPKTAADQDIEKIIIFYKQGHCKVYTP